MAESTTATTPMKPSPADILAGGVAVTSSSASTPFLTIPAGRTWRGSVTVGATQAIAAPAFRDTRVVTAGTNVVPAAGTIIVIACSALDGGPAGATLSDVYVAAPAGNTVTLNLVNSTAFGDQTGTASAAGVLL